MSSERRSSDASVPSVQAAERRAGGQRRRGHRGLLCVPVGMMAGDSESSMRISKDDFHSLQEYAQCT